MTRLLYLWLGLLCKPLLFSQPFEMDTIWWTGSVDDRINLVFLGDGYQEPELDKYITDVHKVTNHFFKQSPFKEYKSYFNIVAIKVPSKDSGAKKDESDDVETYFGSAYNFSGIERLLVASRRDRAQEILFDQFPLFDQAVLIVNDDKYGGSGSWLATTSTHVDAPEIALHEIGHSFAGLADEYWAGEQFAFERANMTRQKDRSKIKWRNWLEYRDVDIYPHQEDPKWVRPHQNCKMRFLDRGFCPVCAEAIVKRVHNLINPVDSFYPDSNQIAVEEGDSVTFVVDLLTPVPNTLKTIWNVNGQDKKRNDMAFVLRTDTTIRDTIAIVVSIADTTMLVRDSAHRESHTFAIPWLVRQDFVSGRSELEISTGIRSFPNPATSHITVQIDPGTVGLQYPAKVEIIDLNGLVQLNAQMWQNPYRLAIAKLPKGIYLIRMSASAKMFLGAFVKY